MPYWYGLYICFKFPVKFQQNSCFYLLIVAMEDSPSFYNKMFNWYELEKNTVNVGTLGWVGTALSDSLQRESKMFKLLSVCIENQY